MKTIIIIKKFKQFIQELNVIYVIKCLLLVLDINVLNAKILIYVKIVKKKIIKGKFINIIL
jgi:hypothetical protein